jgi:tetratricopeptide (TPR) repeat protein
VKPSVHLSRAFGYRELGMYDQSFLELEEIQGDEKWSFEVLEAKYLTCKAAKKWGHAEAYSNGMRIYHPNRIDGWINKAECLCELHGAEKAVETLLLDEERFSKSARYVYAIGRYYALANEIQRAREYVRRAIKMDGSLRAEFIEDSAFDSVWDSF